MEWNVCVYGWMGGWVDVCMYMASPLYTYTYTHIHLHIIIYTHGEFYCSANPQTLPPESQ